MFSLITMRGGGGGVIPPSVCGLEEHSLPAPLAPKGVAGRGRVMRVGGGGRGRGRVGGWVGEDLGRRRGEERGPKIFIPKLALGVEGRRSRPLLGDRSLLLIFVCVPVSVCCCLPCGCGKGSGGWATCLERRRTKEESGVVALSCCGVGKGETGVCV